MQNWGYFQRRMHLSREKEIQEGSQPLIGGSSFDLNVERPTSSYGASNSSWRFFENVPDQLSSLRTAEARSVADRHLRCSLLLQIVSALDLM